MAATPRVHVATMQRNEGTLLRRWLARYGALFGHHALTIYDNCSTDPLTRSLLFHAEGRGVRVYRNMPDYKDKGRLILNLFKKHDSRANRADIYLPVDCDEFLIALTPEGVSFKRRDIIGELVRQRKQCRCLQIPGSFYNDPGRRGAYVLDRPFIKSFFRSGAIGTLDLGFHFATSGLDDAIEQTNLIYLHHHNKQLDAARETARGKLKVAEAIDRDGPGASYLRWLINCSPEQYRTRYSNRIRVTLTPRGPIRILMPNGSAIPWDGGEYHRRYPDVRDSYHLGALHHYLSYGPQEGRMPA